MKNIFLTEMQFQGTIPVSHPNMRTEFAWMYALGAHHENINNYHNVKGCDNVFLIIPKGRVFLSAEGSSLGYNVNPISELLASDIVEVLKSNNSKVHFIQEGPSWWFNDYGITDQVHFINILSKVDSIFAHNEIDKRFYSGWLPTKTVNVIPTLMCEDTISDVSWKPEDKVIIGGNFSRWYGGIQSYRVASEFDLPTWTITSHSTRDGEQNMSGLNHLPRVLWAEWMRHLSTFKYAVHLMPTIAAGTFSLNCAYFGIPCIGNEWVDTQALCFPRLSVDVNDMQSAIELANELKNNPSFYEECSVYAKNAYQEHYAVDVFKSHMESLLCQ